MNRYCVTSLTGMPINPAAHHNAGGKPATEYYLLDRCQNFEIVTRSFLDHELRLRCLRMNDDERRWEVRGETLPP